MQKRRTTASKAILLLGPVGFALALAAFLVARPAALGPLSGMVAADSDRAGDELSFAWSLESLPTGSLALISDPAAIKPSFQADEPGACAARLTATDRFGKSAGDRVIVSTGNLAALAFAAVQRMGSVRADQVKGTS